jgi:hypothetical protein
MVDPSGAVSTLAGEGSPGYRCALLWGCLPAQLPCLPLPARLPARPGPRLRWPTAVSRSPHGQLPLYLVSGRLTRCPCPSAPSRRDGQGTMAKLHHPQGLAVDGDNNVLVADMDSHR